MSPEGTGVLIVVPILPCRHVHTVSPEGGVLIVVPILPCRRVHTVSPEGTGALEQLTRVLTSQPFCLLLSHLTGLDLAENVIRDTSLSTGTLYNCQTIASIVLEEVQHVWCNWRL